MATPSYFSDPQIQFLSQLLDEIADGHLLVPRFQRPVVWTDEQRLELMRSVASSTPIGSIFVWRTRNKVTYYDRLGPYRLNLSERGEFYTYVLDGHQRLSTLFGALRAPRQKGLKRDERDGDPCWDIDYNLDEEEFILADDERGKGRRISMATILDSIESMRFQRKLIEGSGSEAEELISRIEGLTAAFQRFKIPIVPIVSDDVDQVTRTFQKINSQGTSMSQIHMIHALTWSDDFNLNQKVKEIRNEHLAPYGWEEVGDQSILMACKLTLGLDVYEGDVEIVSRSLKDSPQILDDATVSLIGGVEFLAECCGIGSPKLLPYESLLPLLADGLRYAETGHAEIRKCLIYWFWWTTYIHFAGGSNTSRIRRAGEIVRSVAAGLQELSEVMRPVSELPPPPRRYDFRHARSKTLALRMAERRQKIDSSRSEILESLNLHGAGMIQLLIPRSQARKLGTLEDDRLDNLLKSYANRIVASSEEAAGLWRSGLEEENLRELYLIPSGRPQNPSELVDFLEHRRHELETLERDFATGLGILSS